MGHTTNHPEPVTHAADIQLMETFIGVLAHEIRSQIAAICSLSDIMLGNKRTEENERVELLAAINATGYYALNVVDNMTTTAKFSNGKLDLTPRYQRFLFRDWLKQLVQQFDIMIAAVSIKILVDVDSKIPESIVTDQVKLGQILHNLLCNAIKSTGPDTCIKLNVKIRHQQLLFEITDQGGGIPKDKINLLFQPFRQLEKGRAGAGLGLYISKLCVIALGGEISAYCQNGGTTFTFFITPQTDTALAM